jgi:hypothetical protein
MEIEMEIDNVRTYQVTLGAFPESSTDILIIRAKNCATAETMALEFENALFTHVRVTKIEELCGTFVE